jgi:hypothetical protein
MTDVRWAAGRTEKGLPIRRLHCFIPGYLRSLCKKRFAQADDLVDEVEGTPLCVACSRRAGQRGLRLPAAAASTGSAPEASPPPTETAPSGVTDQVSVGEGAWRQEPRGSGVTWRQVPGGRTEHAFATGRRSLCGRYVDESTQPSAEGSRCTPCDRKAATRT